MLPVYPVELHGEAMWHSEAVHEHDGVTDRPRTDVLVHASASGWSRLNRDVREMGESDGEKSEATGSGDPLTSPAASLWRDACGPSLAPSKPALQDGYRGT